MAHYPSPGPYVPDQVSPQDFAVTPLRSPNTLGLSHKAQGPAVVALSGTWFCVLLCTANTGRGEGKKGDHDTLEAEASHPRSETEGVASKASAD